jgi:hypothetical protein
MTTSELGQAQLAQRAYARAVRLFGRDNPRTAAAHRELAAAKVHAAHEVARAAGPDDTDLAAIVRTGQLPAEVTAA